MNTNTALFMKNDCKTAVFAERYATLVSQRNTAAGQLEATYYTLDTARHSKIVALATLNSGITTSYACDANHKTVNAIVFHLLLTDTLAAGDLATLVAIAEQCPLQGGDAVYEARAIVGHFTGEAFDDYEICDDAQQREKRLDTSKLPQQIRLYPNPTTGLVYWQGINGPAVAEVYNHLGQLQLRRELPDASLDLGKLPAGAYWIRLLCEGLTPLTHSVFLVKD